MRKQMLFAHETTDKRTRWWSAEDVFHIMHKYANIQERVVNAKVGFVLNQHPETVHIPIEQLIDVLKQGADDQGIIDSKVPNLNMTMYDLQNSCEMWYSERLRIEAMSCDCGHPNLFSTYNTDCRNWYRTRQLLYKLESMSMPQFVESNPDFDNWYPSTEQWTSLVEKCAVLLSEYLQRYFQSFFEAFYCDICDVPRNNTCADYSAEADRTSPKLSWYWNRVEWTETRGLSLWH